MYFGLDEIFYNQVGLLIVGGSMTYNPQKDIDKHEIIRQPGIIVARKASKMIESKSLYQECFKTILSVYSDAKIFACANGSLKFDDYQNVTTVKSIALQLRRAEDEGDYAMKSIIEREQSTLKKLRSNGEDWMHTYLFVKYRINGSKTMSEDKMNKLIDDHFEPKIFNINEAALKVKSLESEVLERA